MSNAKTFEYKAEMKQLLKLIVHSLYTHPEVFLRELVSNSSDALNKVRFKKLTDSSIIDPESELRIDIKLDKDNKQFTIEDNGIGMTEDDLKNQLGTVASSGTLKFLESLKKENKPFDASMIGKFGVGFYSIFMVTDEVSVETRYAEVGSKAYRWISSGEENYSIEEIEKEGRGTKITFKLKDEYDNFADDYSVKSILKKYSNFVDYPLYVNNERVNTIVAIWQKKKEEISDEEANEFYKFISNDFQEPLDYLPLSIEGTINFKALIFFPQTAPPMLFRESGEKTLQLYSSKVFIQDDAKELLPEYLRFVKGVVDSEDLPLNVSREVTQSSPLLTKIKNIITGKILSKLEEWAEKDEDKYNKFFNQFGSLFKTGVNSDFSNKDRIIELLRFSSSKTESDKFTSFNGYVSRMKSDQDKIYYSTGDSIERIKRNPKLEYFNHNDIEVIYLTDPVDIFTIPYINEYDKKEIISIDKAQVKKNNEGEQKEKLDEQQSGSLISKFKEVLSDKVEDVKVSSRLVESPVALVAGEQGMDAHMEKMMQAMDSNFTSSKKVLEINTSHALIKNLSQLYIADANSQKLIDSIEQLFESALLLDGYLASPNDFVNRMHSFMEEATKIK